MTPRLIFLGLCTLQIYTSVQSAERPSQSPPHISPVWGATCVSMVRQVECYLMYYMLKYYPFPYQTLSGVFATNSGIASHVLPCRTHWPRPSTCIMYGCGTACGTTLFARFGPITLCPKPPKIDFWPTLSPYAT